ncbi:hypothetical protein CsSME_00012221 [Camellia sinensis var. sinensis]
MVADRGKKSKVADRTQDEHSDHIDTDLVLSIEKLQEVQDDLDKFNEEANEKVLEEEQKYNEIRRLVYVKRNEIINSIPDFWLTAFLSHPALGDLLSEEDSKIFKYLDSLEENKEEKSKQHRGDIAHTVTLSLSNNHHTCLKIFHVGTPPP